MERHTMCGAKKRYRLIEPKEFFGLDPLFKVLASIAND
jgi:hypothetical protein